MTAAQPGSGTANFGVVQGTTNAHGCFMRTWQYFPIFGTAPLWHEEKFGMFTAALSAGEVWSAGFGLPSAATTLPVDGVWWQLTTAGLIGRVCFNGVFTDSGILKPFNEFVIGQLYGGSILLGETEVEWWLDGVLIGTTELPSANSQPCLQAALPAFRMKHCTGAVSNTNTMRVADLIVTLADLQTGKSWGEQMVGSGGHVSVGQDGQTQGKTAWWTNSTAPTAAAATNTAAIAGATTFGGLVAVLPTLAANNDGNLFVYQNPAQATNVTGRNIYLTGGKVQGAVSVALTGGPVVYAYAIAYGHTAATLVTAESASFATATAHAPRIRFLGYETYPAAAAVGVIGAGIEFRINPPIVIRPGEFVSLISRNIGTVTTAGAITVGFAPNGYNE
jgi:hypothetical protein